MSTVHSRLCNLLLSVIIFFFCFHDSFTVIVSKTRQSKYSTRIYDKKQACYFCNKLYAKIARHLEDVHSNENEVAAALAYKKNSKERKEALRKLQLKGNYHHNAKVVACGEGELIVRKRPSDDNTMVDARDFLPCPDCLAFLRKSDLWRHQKTCPFKKSEEQDKNQEKSRNLIKESKMMLLPYMSQQSSSLLNELVLSKMKDDDISFICKKDDTILMFGSSIIEKSGERKASIVSSKMRELGRLRKVINEEVDGFLKDFLDPAHFDLVIRSVRKLCGFHRKENETRAETPSLGLKLGHSLNKCGQILKGVGLREKNEDAIKNAQHFLELMKNEWNEKVSACSLATLESGKSSEELIPLTSDLSKVRRYTEKKMKESINEVLYP